MGSFLVKNFGCRVAQSDGAALELRLARAGLTAAEQAGDADLVILNSCTVTSSADEDVRRAVRRVHRQNPAARILVTGCYAQRAPAELTTLPGVAWVVGNSHKAHIPEIVAAVAPARGEVYVGDIFAEQEFLAAPVEEPAGDSPLPVLMSTPSNDEKARALAEPPVQRGYRAGRTRPNLKIQDGCNNRCSFCIIPFVRGRGRSASPEQVVAQVRRLAGRYREVVLSGINLGRWGREPGSRMRLADLIRKLLAETSVERIRLSSVEPMDLSDDLLELMASSPRVAKHMHAPLQTGSDTVLRRMRRKYRPHHYADRILKVWQWMPEAAIGADVMVGFPGETDEEFEQNRRFIRDLPFTYLHVFTYSARPGTPAAAMPHQVPMKVRKQRNRILRELAAAKNLAFRRRFIGGKLSVVTLSRPGAALSDNYIKVELATRRAPNQLIEIEVGEVTADGVRERLPFRVLC